MLAAPSPIFTSLPTTSYGLMLFVLLKNFAAPLQSQHSSRDKHLNMKTGLRQVNFQAVLLFMRLGGPFRCTWDRLGETEVREQNRDLKLVKTAFNLQNSLSHLL
jgi:hypothetical protein